MTALSTFQSAWQTAMADKDRRIAMALLEKAARTLDRQEPEIAVQIRETAEELSRRMAGNGRVRV